MRRLLAIAIVAVVSLGAGPPAKQDTAVKSTVRINQVIPDVEPQKKAAAPRPVVSGSQPTPAQPDPLGLDEKEVARSLKTVGLFALVSLAPAALLMLTAFVRINIVLVLLRQALGSPQVPGNQVVTALALLLTALVMRPVGETVYKTSIEPYAQGKATWMQAYQAASRPIKAFMIEQIKRTNHENYVWAIYDEVTPAGRSAPVYEDEFSMSVVATAFLLSELTTALVIGFLLYLPFLVVDLVVASVLAAMGLFMLPPSLVSTPLKLILFVLVNGWLKVATTLLQSFGPIAGG